MAYGQLTLAQIRTASIQRSNMESSLLITTDEWNSMINESLYELYDLLITTYGADYDVATPVTFTLNGTSQFYPLPDGTLYGAAPSFYKLLGVDLQLSSSSTESYVTLKPFKFNERNRYALPNIQTIRGSTQLRYRLNGNNLMFNLIPAQGQSIRLWYIPRLTELVDDDDMADGVSGWLELVIVDAAIKALIKEESDTSALMARKAELVNRINASAENRDAGESACVSDTQSQFDSGGYGNGYDDGGY